MRNLILHIGRHKTGTTAIQQFLQNNRSPLQELGYFIPQAGRINYGHHGFARVLLPRNKEQIENVADIRLISPFAELKAELVKQDPTLTAIVSSEGFQNCRPDVVGDAFRDYDTSIVVYLRNQLDYLSSAYTQKIHATEYSQDQETYFREIHRSGSNYMSFLRGWEARFPKKLTVRRYNSSDVVHDFVAYGLKVPAEPFTFRSERSNPSLNAVVTAFKRELNRRMQNNTIARLEKIYPILPSLNALFPAAKTSLPPKLAADLVESCKRFDDIVATQYFRQAELFNYEDFETSPEEPISDALFSEMYACLLDLIKTGS